jgi:integrase
VLRAASVPTLVPTFGLLGGFFMAKVPGLVRKKSAFFYVRRIPKTIKPMFGNKTQLTIPLGTSDPRVAANRARAKATEVDAAFQKAKLGVATNFSLASKVSIGQLETAARLHLYEQERGSRSAALSREDEKDASEMLAHLENVEEDWGSLIHGRATQIAEKYRLPIKPGDTYWIEFIDLVHRAETEHQRRRLDRARQVHAFRVYDRFFDEIHDGAARPVLPSETGNALSDVIDRFEKDPHRTHLTESASKKYLIPLAALREVVGDDASISDITRSQCAETADMIARLPANYTKYREFKDKTLREISEMAATSGRKLLARGTVEVYAHHLSAFFNFAIQKGLCATNPATRLMSGAGATKTGRLSFNSDELNRLISLLPDWCGKQRGGRFWLPLIALFSGMRLGEIIWLTQGDIQTVDGVTAFVLSRSEDRSLKTKGSARTVPVHPSLIKLGFSSLVANDLPAHTQLFGDLSGENQKQAVDHFQKRFSYWVKTHVKVREGVSFHSFRHTFRDATRDAELSIDAVRAIGGWRRGSGIEERYGQGAKISKLAEWMGRVSYPGLDLSPLALF